MPGEEQNAKQEIHTADGCSPNSKRPHSSGNVFMVNSSGTSPALLLVRHQAAAPELGAVAQGTCFLKAQSRKTGTAFLLLYTWCHIAQHQWQCTSTQGKQKPSLLPPPCSPAASTAASSIPAGHLLVLWELCDVALTGRTFVSLLKEWLLIVFCGVYFVLFLKS